MPKVRYYKITHHKLKGVFIKKLYLVRHAKAVWNDGHIGDFDRELSKKSEKGLKSVGSYLMLSSIDPDAILSSPAIRAQRTAEILRDKMKSDTKISYMEELYLSSADTMKNLLQHQQNDLQTIMLIGHNPGISDLAGRLTGGEVLKIPKGAVLALSLPIDRWSDIVDGNSSIDFFINPKQFQYARPTATLKHLRYFMKR